MKFHTRFKHGFNKMSMKQYFGHTSRRKRSPGDGHCFVYSVINYYAACDALGNLEYDKLLEDILVETEQNIDTYRCFFDDTSITQLRFQMHDYVRNRNYTMMTSSNGNIFRVTGHLCGKFTGPR